MMNDTDKYRFDFPIQPETLIEAAESLSKTDDSYDQLLAAELADAYDRCEADLSDYRDIDLEENND